MTTFSIIIPHYNDADKLYNCLQSLYHQEYNAKEMEVIVVDDCSPIDVRHQLILKFPDVRFLRCVQRRGPGAARNFGIAHARGKYLAFVDSDALVNPQWLKTFENEFERGEQVVCGPIFHQNSLLGRITALTAFGNFLDTTDGYKSNCPGLNYSIMTEVMKQFSYAEDMIFASEDYLLSTQFVAAGFNIRYAANAWVTHDPVLTIKHLNRRAFFYGIGFSDSRSRNARLPGYWLHKHLKGASCLVLFGIRVILDFVRMFKHRNILTLNLLNVLPIILGILWVRVVYATGVAAGYRKKK